MNEFISHISAAKLWDIPYLDTIFGVLSGEAGASLMKADSAVLHRTFGSERERKRAGHIQSYVVSGTLPSGSVVRHKGERVASPELLFLEAAEMFGFHRALLLGLTLCGKPPKPQSRLSMQYGDSFMPQGEALTTSRKIRAFIGKTKRQRGHDIACRAAKYLADGSASLMESLLYMFLVLRHHYGGYGLKGAEFNRVIRLNGRESATGKRQFVVDLCWEEAKLAVEYDSYTHHANKSSWANDERRTTALRSLGYNVIRINTDQIYSDIAFAKAAQIVADGLGKRIRIRDAGFRSARQQLRSLLPPHMYEL
ncbi:MAG: endonuclease domain-containing protein [Clostridiales Family XIII bacterium]|jgi:hypothetical protein|nr:endonuclease domain-containing protein [Clostridiales Family XIII bacterium]